MTYESNVLCLLNNKYILWTLQGGQLECLDYKKSQTPPLGAKYKQNNECYREFKEDN